MLFNSFPFLLFFPIVALLYFAIPHRFRHLWLLAASYYFYMSWNPKYALLMALSTVLTFTSGILIDRENRAIQAERQAAAIGRRRKILWVALSLISNLSILFFFKYFHFFIANLNRILGAVGLTLLNPSFDVLLPVGISFYTFQALSYTMDVYRGEIAVERSLFKYALFVSFFPQLVAGPIERSKNLLHQVSEYHAFDYERVRRGLMLMLWGFFMKLAIADKAALVVNTVYNDYAHYEGWPLGLATFLFAIQIYCDFGAYSAIAIGSAEVMGFRLMTNFRQPYFSLSITEFWQRWHISLSTWFRDYLYIPLGGNRKGRARKHLNTMIVFLVSGLWHGANWTFIVWGGLHGLFQVVGQITRPWKQKMAARFRIDQGAGGYKFLQGLLTFCLVDFAWIFFRSPTIHDAGHILNRMTTVWNPWILTDGTLFQLGLDAPGVITLAVGCLVLLAASLANHRGVVLREWLDRQILPLRWASALLALFAILLFGVYGPGYSASQFIYFQF